MQSTELWKPIPGYEGIYEVSDHGNVRSLDRAVTNRLGHVQHRKGVTLKPGPGKHGRLFVVLVRGDDTRWNVPVHRLVLLAFVGEPPAGTEACHNNGDHLDNRLCNLRWDTKSANTLDAVKHGTHPKTRRTHCPQGHPLEGANLRPIQIKRGRRECLACSRARAHAYNKGLEFDPVVANAYYERITRQS